jgi:hypothetical protein
VTETRALGPGFLTVRQKERPRACRATFNVKEATRKANEGLTGSGHDDELA